LKIGVPSGCLRETSIFKIIMTDDVTLWSKLELSHAYVYLQTKHIIITVGLRRSYVGKTFEKVNV